MADWKRSVPSREQLRDAKRNAVLREASASFNKHGYHGTSMDDIAQRLEVTKPALYYYFPNKQAMLKACFDQAMEVAFANLERARRDGGDGRQKLRVALSDLLEYFIGEHSVAITVLEEGSLSPDDFQAVKAERQRFEHALRDIVGEGIKDGSIVPCDPKLAVLALLGALSWVPRWYRADGDWSRAQLNTLMTELLERMLSSAPVARLQAPRRRRTGAATAADAPQRPARRR
ncbi:MAG: TetR family transcriptional regulator [Stenotrophomonas nitritireducens]|uniref:TetR/AcrR family transcriptional regulator n=1 Tax=Stenotrophomonas TaxID=40323 RepID=UPI001AD3024F|nr:MULTISPECIES: TetR/AcrR family transcriptional regulator [Stenotrophomonas]MBN8792456.1 TetR family transcriptional regulator [Stenotrophomonas nitritireducens]MBN8796861.1 TetR family transcriptional regulator [Stenotrophomonas nitritireducens]